MIDFHTHIFPDAIAEKSLPHLAEVCQTIPYTDAKKDGLLQSARNAKIDCSIILPVVTAPKQFESIHRFAMQFMEGELISFGGIHPSQEDYKEKLRWIKSHGFKGIKLHPDYQDTYFNDISYKRIISYATELDMIIVTHAGVDPLCPLDVHCTPSMAAEVIQEVQPTKLVLAHMGGNGMYDDVEKHIVGKNVFLDTSFVLDKMEKEQFMRIVKDHGEDNILFATDSPWASQSDFVNYFQQLPIDKTAKEKISFSNAEKLLRGI